MIGLKDAKIILEKYLSKNPKTFRIPEYRGVRKLLYWFILCIKKIRYNKLYLDDYESTQQFIFTRDFKEINQPYLIIESIEYETAFIFYVGTKMNYDGFFRYLQYDLRGPFLVDKETSNLYEIGFTPIPEIYIGTLEHMKKGNKVSFQCFDKILN